MKKFREWFNLNLGWFFVNGRKQEKYAKEMLDTYGTSSPKTSDEYEKISNPLFCNHVLRYKEMHEKKNKTKKKHKHKQSICQEAHNIVNDRNEEKERMYGPFSEGMDRAAQIYNGMTGLNITGKEMYIALIALKFSRESYTHKRDNLLDAVSYIQGLDNYENNKK